MRKVSIVIPNYNGESLLKNNLSKVVKIFSDQEIIVVDDGSTDNSVFFIKENFPRIRLIKNKVNLGFSSTANKGVKSAMSEIVFLLNNDCYPENNFLDLIIPYFKNSKTFAVSCLEKINGINRGRGIGSFKKGLLVHRAGETTKNNTLWAFGASVFYNKRIFKQLGGFDENLNPFYWEDFDLSYRALKSGYKIFFERKAVVQHQQSSTIKKNFSDFQIQEISFRNQLLTIWKNISDKDLIVQHFLWLPFHLLITTIKTKGAFLSGFIKALFKTRQVFKKRKENNFVFSDKEVLKPFQKEFVS